MFEIKDLEWERGFGTIYSENVIGRYVYFTETKKMAFFPRTPEVKFHEFDIENSEDKFKQKANEHWRSVLMPFLREAGDENKSKI
jgi:hypothetical protein